MNTINPHTCETPNWDVSMQRLNNLETRNNEKVDRFINFQRFHQRQHYEPCWGFQRSSFNQHSGFVSNKYLYPDESNFLRNNGHNGNEFFARMNVSNGPINSVAGIPNDMANNYVGPYFPFYESSGKFQHQISK